MEDPVGGGLDSAEPRRLEAAEPKRPVAAEPRRLAPVPSRPVLSRPVLIRPAGISGPSVLDVGMREPAVSLPDIMEGVAAPSRMFCGPLKVLSNSPNLSSTPSCKRVGSRSVRKERVICASLFPSWPKVTVDPTR